MPAMACAKMQPRASSDSGRGGAEEEEDEGGRTKARWEGSKVAERISGRGARGGRERLERAVVYIWLQSV